MKSNLLSTSEATETHEASDRSVVQHLQESAVFSDYQDAFENTTQLPLMLRRVGSFQAPMQGSKKLNPFCAIMAASNKTCAACLQLQQKVEESASSEAVTMECFAGLSESAVPVRVGEKILGYLQTGQVLLRPPTKTQFRKTMQLLEEWKISVDAAALEKAYFATRVITSEQYQSVVRLVAIFAQHLSALSNQLTVQTATAESPQMAKARQFVADHHSEDISLSQVASAVHTTPFYFCKLFKKATGLTFTDYLARVRVERVKHLLLNPHTRVSEAAFEAGFQSLSQFNRVFHRIEGESPSDYRAKLHEQI
ncbi:MAG TPA: PocR ligand-binding domain-containing protein [Opitutaceae bacterium]|nr:PocR ligand-binding domain-containing protein [Opitutaceae bacterium]